MRHLPDQRSVSSLLLVGLLLGFQVLSLQHMVGHGFGEPDHDGRTCAICLLGEQIRYAHMESPLVLPAPALAGIALQSPPQPLFTLPLPKGASPRAPPPFSPAENGRLC